MLDWVVVKIVHNIPKVPIIADQPITVAIPHTAPWLTLNFIRSFGSATIGFPYRLAHESNVRNSYQYMVMVGEKNPGMARDFCFGDRCLDFICQAG